MTDGLAWRGTLLAYIRETGICFVLATLALTLAHERAAESSDLWLIRAGMLRDLAAELPIGRQAAVSSPAFMPLPVVAALPFLPFVSPAGTGYAYLYGLAALLALAAQPLRLLLARWGAGRLQVAAPLLLALAAAALGPTEHGDLLACLAMLILAVFLERRDLAEMRALAGVFWGLVLFAHAAGIALVALRLVGDAAVRGWRRLRGEEKAIRWIQAVSVAYVVSIYLFLNWMIMGSAVYPARGVSSLWRSGRGASGREPLADALARTCPGLTPVASGHWSYVIRPVLAATGGYAFIDFHPAKLPAGETRSLVLVVPAPTHPLVRFSDLSPGRPADTPGSVRYLRLAQTPDWIFYLIDTGQ
jgi:hypothetical protein